MHRNITIIKFILLSLTFLEFSISQTRIRLEGKITDTDNNPLPFVNVFLLNTSEGGLSNEAGKYSFNTKKTGTVTLVASMIGYRKFNKEIILDPKKNISLDIQLEKEAIKLNETVVTASSFSSEKKKGLVVSSMDVLTTPGGAADIFQSLKTLPGLTNVSESAELYIRGGDPIETVTMLDQASLYHPYTFESAYGGLFSNLSTSCMKGMYFSSGGFSAKYGNVLSGVLDIETKNEPESPTYNLGISLANVSLAGETPLFSQKVGLRFDFRQNFTKPIFWLNGGNNAIMEDPISRNATASLIYKYSNTGRIKIDCIFADDKQGVLVKRAEYDGTFNGISNNNFINIQDVDILSEIILKTSLSFNQYGNTWKLGVLNIGQYDYVYKIRSDMEYKLNTNIRLFSGLEMEKRISKYDGIIPTNDYDISPEAQSETINAEFSVLRFGAYTELEIARLFDLDRSSLVAGIRLDNMPYQKIQWIDPRISLGYKLNDNSSLRAGLGIYHQLPDSRLYAKSDGNPNLKSMSARHFIISYDNDLSEENSLRVELYHKQYLNLPLKDDLLNYNNNGYGYANGIDIIIKGILPFGIDGWLSYGFIDTKRKWMDFEELARSTYDITHNFTVIIKYNFTPMWQIGVDYKLSSGKPYTPVLGAIFHPELNIYEPIYGDKNSSSFPNYQRLDFRVTHFDQVFGKYFCVFYLEALNILGIKNIFDYTYNKDYTQKSDIISYFGRRTLVFGMNMNL